jgi:hypothetical protein
MSEISWSVFIGAPMTDQSLGGVNSAVRTLRLWCAATCVHRTATTGKRSTELTKGEAVEELAGDATPAPAGRSRHRPTPNHPSRIESAQIGNTPRSALDIPA